ncbi:hypothetical protein ABZ354_28505 [Streptomyces sp. NPDC005925]|uniref:hypothetical protein n=1 Tax=Streptomyces sp. NPDC005925 TaxID=3157172 RepID=UPI0033EC3AB6
MRMKIVAAVGFTCLLATACGGTEAGSDDAGTKPDPARTVLPQRLDQPDMDPDLEPSAPADDAPFTEQLEHELIVGTLKMAQAEGRTTAQCPGDVKPAKGKKTTCTSTYEGLKIEWTVTFGDDAAWSSDYVQYDAKPSTGIITRAGVAKLLFGNFEGSIDHALCNDIPKAVLAPLNAKSTYACEVVDKGEKPQGWTSAVHATDAGPRVY